jgi:hypothetical protein
MIMVFFLEIMIAIMIHVVIPMLATFLFLAFRENIILKLQGFLFHLLVCCIGIFYGVFIYPERIFYTIILIFLQIIATLLTIWLWKKHLNGKTNCETRE